MLLSCDLQQRVLALDRRLDTLAHAFLGTLQRCDVVVGRKNVVVSLLSCMLESAPKPLLLVVSRQAANIASLEDLATTAGVPVVYALPKVLLADALGQVPPVSIVGVMNVPTPGSRALLIDMLDRALQRYVT